jgi:diguanylate cyclase (GGDEF)-like protein
VTRTAFAVLAVLLATHLLHALGVLAFPKLLGETLYDAVMAGAAALCAARAVCVSAERAPWLMLALGVALWFSADLLFDALYGMDGIPPYPNVTDGLYLGSYLSLYAGVVLLLASRLRPFPRSLSLDGLVAGLTLAAFAAAFAFDAVLSSTDGPPLTVIVTLAYPVADLLLLCFVGIALALTGWRPDRAWALIALGFVLTAVADVIYTYAASADSYLAGGLTDTLWAGSALAIALAAWQGGAPARQAAGDTVAALVPAVFALAALALLICGWFTDLPAAAGILAMLALLAAVARAALTFAENIVLLRRSRDEALLDALSGLGNRRLLLRDLESAFADRGRAQTLVFLDLDGFKTYNDSFGHIAGDALLARLAGRLARSVEGHGAAYRLGGDEFCVLLEPPLEDGHAVVLGAARALTDRGEAFSIGASHGVAQIPREAAGAEQAVRLADERMYAAKEARRGAGKHQAHDVLVQVLAEREPDLHDHLREVAQLARGTAIELGLDADEIDRVVRAAELHDIGKIAVPDSVLHKPGPLDEEEWEIMRQHSVVGERILASVPALRAVGELVRSTHESWDGAGYPDGLQAGDIPLGARIIAVCDAFDAMTSARPYAPPRDPEQAILELRRCAAVQFDPAVVRAFLTARGGEQAPQRTAARHEQPAAARRRQAASQPATPSATRTHAC